MNESFVYRLHRSNRTIALNVTLHYPSTNHSERGRIHLASIVPDVSCPIYDKLDQEIHQGIDQSKLVPLLTAALQEAIAKIEVLETKVAALGG